MAVRWGPGVARAIHSTARRAHTITSPMPTILFSASRVRSTPRPTARACLRSVSATAWLLISTARLGCTTPSLRLHHRSGTRPPASGLLREPPPCWQAHVHAPMTPPWRRLPTYNIHATRTTHACHETAKRVRAAHTYTSAYLNRRGCDHTPATTLGLRALALLEYLGQHLSLPRLGHEPLGL